MNCFVLGGAGFIGRNLCAALVAAGHSVRAYDLAPGPAAAGWPELAGVEWIAGDLAQIASAPELLDDVDIVFHLVSSTLPSTSNQNPLYDLESNVSSTVRLLDLIVSRSRPPRLVYVSSGGTVYGAPQAVPIKESHALNPLCAYGVGKLAAEKYLSLYRHLHQLDYRILRLANPYGAYQPLGRGQGVIPVFLSRALRGEPFELWGDGSVVRDYLYIDDLCEAFLAVMDYQGHERVFNVGSGQGHSLNELIEIISQILKSEVERIYLPARKCDVPVNVLDIELIGRELGWRPRTPLVEGMTALLPWLQSL